VHEDSLLSEEVDMQSVTRRLRLYLR
jgi:hypothetical protein